MKYLVAALLFSILPGPVANGKTESDELCYSDKLFIFYSAKNFELNFASEEHRSHVESESAEIVELYESLDNFPSLAGHYADPDELKEICGRLDAEELRKLILYLGFFEMSTREAVEPEQ